MAAHAHRQHVGARRGRHRGEGDHDRVPATGGSAQRDHQPMRGQAGNTTWRIASSAAASPGRAAQRTEAAGRRPPPSGPAAAPRRRCAAAWWPAARAAAARRGWPAGRRRWRRSAGCAPARARSHGRRGAPAATRRPRCTAARTPRPAAPSRPRPACPPRRSASASATYELKRNAICAPDACRRGSTPRPQPQREGQHDAEHRPPPVRAATAAALGPSASGLRTIELNSSTGNSR